MPGFACIPLSQIPALSLDLGRYAISCINAFDESNIEKYCTGCFKHVHFHRVNNE